MRPPLLALAVLVFCSSARAEEAPRPNILFCFADDWGRYAGAYAAADRQPSANDIIKTPNIDAVARRGVLFRHAFVSAPSCTPCRSALLTGRYFFNTGRGAILNGAHWDGSIPSWPLLLRDAGYHLGKSYKVWSPGDPADAPYGGQQHAYEKAGRRMNKFSANATKLISAGATPDAAKAEILGEVRGNFDAFLAARPAGAPFCFWFGPTNTHRIFQKGSGQALWGIDPETLEGKMPAWLPDVPEVREDFADYLGEAQAFDAAIGVLLQRLSETGELDRTLVVISGDHGMPGVPGGKCNLYDFGTNVGLVIAGPGVKGGRVVDDFASLPDLAPTFLEAGRAPLPAGMSARSLWPVLASEKSGQVDPTRSWVITGRERHVAAARDGNLPYPQRALRTREFLYIRNFEPDRWPLGSPGGVTETDAPPNATLAAQTYAAFSDMDASPTKAWLIEHRRHTEWQPLYDRAFSKRPAEELYDLAKDPGQTRNVAADPAYAKPLQEMSVRLMTILTDAADPRVTGDGQTFERPPFTDPRQGAGKKNEPVPAAAQP